MTGRRIASKNSGVKVQEPETAAKQLLAEMDRQPTPFGTATELGPGNHGIHEVTGLTTIRTPFGVKPAVIFGGERYIRISHRLKSLLEDALGQDVDSWEGQKVEVSVERSDDPGRYRHRFVFRAVGASLPPARGWSGVKVPF